MSKIPVFIINYNRLDLPKNMADHIAVCDGVYPVIIDNHSTYPKLLEYYKTCPHKIIQMNKNYGNCVMWNSNLYIDLNLNGNFIYTDPDLDICGVPTDFLHVLQTGLDRYPADKCGLSLEINDLPINEMTKEVHRWEDQNWTLRLDDMYFSAAVDTTFALYRTNIHSFNCIRTNRPYTARHMPWYYTKDNIPPDELYYLQSTGAYFNHWTNRLKKDL